MFGARVRDLMTPNVVSVRPEDDVATAYALMRDNAFRHLIVTDREGRLAGVLTSRDLLRHSLVERPDVPQRQVRVEEVMTSRVGTAAPGQPIQEAARLMLDHEYGCLPVLEGARVVGILTASDFVRFFALTGQRPAIAGLGT